MIVPTAKEHWPRLSQDLPHERHPYVCQACGWDVKKNAKLKVEPEQTDLRRWREFDQQDHPQGIIVVLCVDCGKKLIEPHERLYDCLKIWEPAPGAMLLCVDCTYRQGLHCSHPDLKENGGPGLVLKMPTPGHGFWDGRDVRGRRIGGPMKVYYGPITFCEGRHTPPAPAKIDREVPCSSCKRMIVWMVTTNGRQMPVNAETVGTEKDIYNPKAGHISHFTDCPQSKEWSKKKKAK